MPKYRMTFGRNNTTENKIVERDFDSDSIAIFAFNERRGMQDRKSDCLQTLDRIDINQKERITRIANKDQIHKPDTSFEGIVLRGKALKKEEEEVEGLLKLIKAGLSEVKDSLDLIVEPIVRKAIAEYNKEQGYDIRLKEGNIGYGISDELPSIGLSVQLIDSRGGEPDEDCDGNEIKGYNHKLGVILHRLFQEKGLVINFSGISVPSSYYMK